MDIFIAEVNGSSAPSQRNIYSSLNTVTMPAKYVWLVNGDNYEAVE
jgi:hypothetical protein